ncbi:MAG: yxeB5 [Paenibacillus sp.]|nr:yxeB5 [Paenibacillus sp.]
MKRLAKQSISVIAAATMMGLLLIGCTSGNSDSGSTKGDNGGRPAGSNTEASNGQTGTKEQATTRSYTDYKGHTVQIPAAPKRVVFAGETTGDLIELDIPMIGIFGDYLDGRVYQKEAAQIENVGFPLNLEKVISLNPDLIIIANTDEKAYAQLDKIAPTIMFDTFASLDDRFKELGVIFNKQQQTADWLKAHHAKTAEMWKKLYATVLKPGETASVFTYYPGDRLFVMARAGLPQLLYGEGGLKPTAPIQQVLDAKEGFRQISVESLPEFAGDRIFILDPVADEAKKSTDALINSAVWKGLPAVKNGDVYRLYIQKSDSDAASREWLLEELPRMLAK